MATFPTLKTGAFAQYPASRSLEYRNQVLRFVDGSEQRYRDSAGPLRRWIIRLNQLDPTEISLIEAFFLTNQGAFASFAFVDPWDGKSYPDCRIASDILAQIAQDEFRNATSITIMENRG
jgi:hypothetical protein